MTNQQPDVINASSANRIKEENYPALPKGNYTLVSVDIDTTGRRLIDEVKIYTKNYGFYKFSQKFCQF